MQDRRSNFGAPVISLSKNLVEFAPAGAKKVQSFSSATCAAKKILLGLQTCAPSSLGGRRVRCSQAVNPFVKKYYFLTASSCCVTHAICASTLGTDVPP